MPIDHAMTVDFRPIYCPMCGRKIPLGINGKVAFYEGRPYICSECRTEITYQFPMEPAEADTDR